MLLDEKQNNIVHKEIIRMAKLQNTNVNQQRDLGIKVEKSCCSFPAFAALFFMVVVVVATFDCQENRRNTY